MNGEIPMHEAGHSKPVPWDNSEGWGVGREVGEGFRMEGTHVHPWLIHVDIWQKPQYCNHPPMKKNNLKKEGMRNMERKQNKP